MQVHIICIYNKLTGFSSFFEEQFMDETIMSFCRDQKSK